MSGCITWEQLGFLLLLFFAVVGVLSLIFAVGFVTNHFTKD